MDVKSIESAARVSRAYPPIDFFKIPGFPNHFDGENTSYPFLFFHGHDNDHSARFHVVMFLSHMSELNICHEDHMLQMFAYSLQGNASCWLHEGLPDKSITSLENFFEIFLKQWHYDGNDTELFNIESFIKTNMAYFFPGKNIM